MKLNPDCVRSILLAVEDTCDTQHYFDSILDSNKILGEYTEEEIAYHARQCDLSGFLYKYSSDLNGRWSASDLTPKGHEFLANIRSNSNWDKVKAISAKVGSKSLSALETIATSVITNLLSLNFKFVIYGAR